MSQTKEIENVSEDVDIIPARLAVTAMRDSGYKNTAYALAELIDNSVQAKAKSIELICVEEEETINQRTRRKLREIGVMDNGEGMPSETLHLALQFGNGTHLEDRKRIGKGLADLVWACQIHPFHNVAASTFGHGRMVPITRCTPILTLTTS